MSLPKTQEQSKAVVHLMIGLVIVVIAIIFANKLFKLGSGALEFLNLKDTAEEKENKEYVANKVDKANNNPVKSAWSLSFWNYPQAMLINAAETKRLVKMLWDSVGYMYDTPNNLPGAIKQCKTQSQVSWLCYNFQKEHDKDLIGWLDNHFDTSEQKKILADTMRYVENLPKYNV
jgi:hypothetical protein